MQTADSAAWGPADTVSSVGPAARQLKEASRAVHLPVSGYIQHVQLSCVGEFRRQNGQAVIPQGEDAECHTAPNLGRQHLQAVPVHIEVGQLAQLPQGAG